ncbi:alpha/beta fold hydrolase [Pseudonocardia phyllosphaerae]|uniref:alpha/beta fold hydrolase n=1 Tax=Pseudonocardia phyllosphaerae TaxID=3390502 RepID=UPI0039783CBA
MEREVEIEPGVRLWAEDLPALTTGPGSGGPAPVLLVADPDTSGLSWPDELVELLRARHRVIRYDHRDTGRSTRGFDRRPYEVADLAADVPALLDTLGVEQVHAVGFGDGARLVQLLLLDAPGRLRSATLLCTAALGAEDEVYAGALPRASRDVRRMWTERGDARDERGELVWRVEYRRRLHGAPDGFDRAWTTAQERREMAHAGRTEPAVVHAQADPGVFERAGELAGVTTPTLVVEGPDDPVYPPPHAAHLAGLIGPAAQAVAVDGLGHALVPSLLPTIATLVLDHADDCEPV